MLRVETSDHLLVVRRSSRRICFASRRTIFKRMRVSSMHVISRTCSPGRSTISDGPRTAWASIRSQRRVWLSLEQRSASGWLKRREKNSIFLRIGWSSPLTTGGKQQRRRANAHSPERRSKFEVSRESRLKMERAVNTIWGPCLHAYAGQRPTVWAESATPLKNYKFNQSLGLERCLDRRLAEASCSSNRAIVSTLRSSTAAMRVGSSTIRAAQQV